MDLLTNIIIKGYIALCATKYGVDPAFATAVATVESRKDGHEFRIGRLGRSRYYGPMGINQSFLSKWPIDNLFTNIEVGVRALRGPQDKVLRRYNAECNDQYRRAVRLAMRQYQKEWGK